MSDLPKWAQTLHDTTKDRDAWREVAVKLARDLRAAKGQASMIELYRGCAHECCNDKAKAIQMLARASLAAFDKLKGEPNAKPHTEDTEAPES